MLGHEHGANDLAPSRNGGLDIVDMPLKGPLDRPKVNRVMVTGGMDRAIALTPMTCACQD